MGELSLRQYLFCGVTEHIHSYISEKNYDEIVYSITMTKTDAFRFEFKLNGRGGANGTSRVHSDSDSVSESDFRRPA